VPASALTRRQAPWPLPLLLLGSAGLLRGRCQCRQQVHGCGQLPTAGPAPAALLLLAADLWCLRPLRFPFPVSVSISPGS
jgi:hypothetical protein